MAYPNLLVRDFMTTDQVVFQPDLDIEEAIRLILARNLPGAPVVEERRLVGILAERDVFRLLANRTFGFDNEVGGRVRDFMTRDLVTVGPTDDLASVCSRFLAGTHRALPVVEEDGVLAGMVTRRDLLRALVDLRRQADLDRFPDYRRPQG